MEVRLTEGYFASIVLCYVLYKEMICRNLMIFLNSLVN